MRLESPIALLALFVLPLLFWIRARQQQTGIPFSSIAEVVASGRSWRQRLLWVPLWMQLLVFVLLTIALARPQQGFEQVQESKRGIAIEMVIDRSPSMAAEMNFHGQHLSRLEVVKRVFKEFVLGNGQDLSGRSNDWIGIVSFAGSADTICPLTLSHETFPAFLDAVNIHEGATAIGDAIALAAARLEVAAKICSPKSPVSDDRYSIKSTIIILLTDGQNNAGKWPPLQAADLAAKWGIKIYTVGIGGKIAAENGPWGNIPGGLIEPVDETALKSIAQRTGGLFRMGENAAGLRAICQKIDQLERSEIQVTRFRKNKECFAPLAVAAILLAAIETLLNCTIFRSIP